MRTIVGHLILEILTILSRVVSRHQNDRATYASLDTRSNALARGLESLGVRKGERVGVMLGNSMEYAVVCWVIVEIGRKKRARLISETRQHMRYSSLAPFW